MPIAIQGLYKCQKCGYKEYRYVSDGNAIRALKPCPKCYSSMRKLDDLEKDLLDMVRERVGKIFSW